MALIQDERPLTDRTEPRRNLTANRWRNTVIAAPLVDIAQDKIALQSIAYASPINLALFLADTPAALFVFSKYAGAQYVNADGAGTAAFAGYDIETRLSTATVPSISGSDLVQIGGPVASGEIATVGLPTAIPPSTQVPAYLATCTTPDILPALQYYDSDRLSAESEALLSVFAVANGSVQDGTPAFNGDADSTGQIILQAGAVTQEIIEAGWIFTDAGGSTFNVVGLFEEV